MPCSRNVDKYRDGTNTVVIEIPSVQKTNAPLVVSTKTPKMSRLYYCTYTGLPRLHEMQ